MIGYTKAVFEALVETIAPETPDFADIRREELPNESDREFSAYMIEALNDFGESHEGWLGTVCSGLGIDRLPYATMVAVVLDLAAAELLVRGRNHDAVRIQADGSLIRGPFSALSPDDRNRAIRLLGDGGFLARLDDRFHATIPQLGVVRLAARGLDALSQLARKTESFRLDSADPAIYGPTDINAQSGNQSLSVALNAEGTMTVFRWPRPSFYDHINYLTKGRRDDGSVIVGPNKGAFLGLWLRIDGSRETTWLRDWESTQHYVDERSDTIRTTYHHAEYGLSVVVTDVVAHGDDAFVRRVRVRRRFDSPVERATLLAFENLNPVVSKHPQYPTRDWCEEERNTDRARYAPDDDALIHTNTGVDTATGKERSVAVAMGFDVESTHHHIGGDNDESIAGVHGKEEPRDAYDSVNDGSILGNDQHSGQTTGVLSCVLDFESEIGGTDETESADEIELTNASEIDESETASAIVIFAVGSDDAEAGRVLERTRKRGFENIHEKKRAWFGDLLADAPMPGTDDPDIRVVCERALVTLVTNYDPASGAIVASIATQSPYAEDWVRDGAYFNYALDLIGLHDWVSIHNRWYAAVQQRADDPRRSLPATPPGNWGMSYYGDGVAGGPIPYEIDETGFGIWTLWDHYTVTGDREYLQDVYGAIERAADSLIDQRDPETGLQSETFEDDRFETTQSIRGAGPVWLGLDAAVKAAREVGADASADRYAARRDEVGTAIEEVLYDEETGAYGTKRAGFSGPTLVWPVGFKPFDHPRMVTHLDALWEDLRTTFAEPAAGEHRYGGYEPKGLLALAKARRTSEPGSIEQVREGLRWVATRHATPDTHILGESWVSRDGEVNSIVSQPHAWEQVLFYLASLEAYPPAGVEYERRTHGSVLEALRERNAPQ